jgi:nitrogen fixation NifU-like protein
MMPSKALLDHCRNPRNVGVLARIDERVTRATARSAECGDTLQLEVRLDQSRAIIAEARFKAYGCSATIAAGSFVTEWLAGRPASAAGDLTEDVISDALDLVPDEAHAAALAVRVVREAIDLGTRRAGS